jgi:C4-dicarboxylate transporter DctM subunit
VIIFVLLIAMMRTGMPISIALGLTVLIFIFTMPDVQIDVVALKLFTGIEKFEIMAIPFFAPPRLPNALWCRGHHGGRYQSS